MSAPFSNSDWSDKTGQVSALKDGRRFSSDSFWHRLL